MVKQVDRWITVTRNALGSMVQLFALRDCRGESHHREIACAFEDRPLHPARLPRQREVGRVPQFSVIHKSWCWVDRAGGRAGRAGRRGCAGQGSSDKGSSDKGPPVEPRRGRVYGIRRQTLERARHPQVRCCNTPLRWRPLRQLNRATGFHRNKREGSNDRVSAVDRPTRQGGA